MELPFELFFGTYRRSDVLIVVVVEVGKHSSISVYFYRTIHSQHLQNNACKNYIYYEYIQDSLFNMLIMYAN